MSPSPFGKYSTPTIPHPSIHSSHCNHRDLLKGARTWRTPKLLLPSTTQKFFCYFILLLQRVIRRKEVVYEVVQNVVYIYIYGSCSYIQNYACGNPKIASNILIAASPASYCALECHDCLPSPSRNPGSLSTNLNSYNRISLEAQELLHFAQEASQVCFFQILHGEPVTPATHGRTFDMGYPSKLCQYICMCMFSSWHWKSIL